MSNDAGPFDSAGFRPRQLASLKKMASELDSGDDEDDERKGYQRDYEKEWGKVIRAPRSKIPGN